MLEEKLTEGIVHKQWEAQEASKTSERTERYSTKNSSIYTLNSFNRSTRDESSKVACTSAHLCFSNYSAGIHELAFLIVNNNLKQFDGKAFTDKNIGNVCKKFCTWKVMSLSRARTFHVPPGHKTQV